MSRPSNISGFSIIPIAYNSSTTHYLYARAHASSKSDARKILPEGRTLFLVNVPPDATERELVLLFKHSGTVEKVLFDFNVKEINNDVSDSEDDEDESMDDAAANDEEEQPARKKKKQRNQKHKEELPTIVPLPTWPLRKIGKTGRSAHVIFLDASSLERALASTSKPRAWPTSSEEPSHYQALYASLRPPLDSVRAYADSFLEVHEYNLAKQRQKSKYRKGDAIVDEDGFTLVTRGGAYGQTLGGGVGVASKRFQRSGQTTSRSRGQKKERKDKAGFYAFQKAEKQRSELMELKRKWEEDKAKVEQLKASRRFKPY